VKNKPIAIEEITRFQGPEESPGYLLWRVSMQWRNAIESVLKQLDLTHPQFVVLAATGWLTRKNQNIAQVAIGKTAGLDPNTTSQILRTLEAKKLIKRAHSVNERNKTSILTQAGSKKLAQAMPTVEQADEEYFSKLSSQETTQIVKIFQQLISQKGI
jgi:DNA-binding MarR family transcriptional regulator